MIIFNLDKVAKDRNMTMTELSEKTGISRTSLSQLSTGKTQGIQFKNLDKILTELNCSVKELITHIGEKPKDLEINVKTELYNDFNLNEEEIDTDYGSYKVPVAMYINLDLKIEINKPNYVLSIINSIDAAYSFTGINVSNENTIQLLKYESNNKDFSDLIKSNLLNDIEKYEIHKEINNELLKQAIQIYKSETGNDINIFDELFIK